MICPDGGTHGGTSITIHEGIFILKKISERNNGETRMVTIGDTWRDSHKDIRITRKDTRKEIREGHI